MVGVSRAVDLLLVARGATKRGIALAWGVWRRQPV